MIQKIKITPDYIYENGVWNLNIDSIELPAGFHKYVTKLLSIPAYKVSGNHKHPRSEVFLSSSSNLILLWESEDGNCHEEYFVVDDETYLILVKSNTPHAIINKSDSEVALIEFADGELRDVVACKLV